MDNRTDLSSNTAASSNNNNNFSSSTLDFTADSASSSDSESERPEIIAQEKLFKKIKEKMDILTQSLSWNFKIDWKVNITSALSFLDQCRSDPFFKEIKRKISEKKEVTPGELIYFALTTDDISQLHSNDIAWGLNQFAVSYTTKLNLTIMQLALRYSEVTDTNEKNQITKKINSEFKERKRVHETPEAFYFNQGSIFLNLAGINLEEAEAVFSDAELYFINLENANFKATNLTDMHIIYSNLTKINMANAKSDNSITFFYSIVRNANFTQVDFHRFGEMRGSDFTGSNFSNAKIGVVFDKTILTATKWDDAVLINTRLHSVSGEGKCDLQQSRLVGILTTLPLRFCNCKDITVLPPECFQTVSSFQTALTLLQKQIDYNLSDPNYLYLINQDVLLSAATENIVEYIQNSDIDCQTKIAILNEALENPVFQWNNTAVKYLNSLAKKGQQIYSYLFAQPKESHVFCPSKAQAIFESLRDRILATNKNHILDYGNL